MKDRTHKRQSGADEDVRAWALIGAVSPSITLTILALVALRLLT
jgi:hypothetical protein